MINLFFTNQSAITFSKASCFPLSINPIISLSTDKLLMRKNVAKFDRLSAGPGHERKDNWEFAHFNINCLFLFTFFARKNIYCLNFSTFFATTFVTLYHFCAELCLAFFVTTTWDSAIIVVLATRMVIQIISIWCAKKSKSKFKIFHFV